MNSNEFLTESKEYIDELYKKFSLYQSIVNDTFDHFHKICKDNGITYFVAFGSLLGLIRDNGNIPWDYDIDVVVPYSEKDKLIRVLDKFLGNEYYYKYKNNTSRYPTSCLRVCKKGYSYMAFHVDVFFLMGCPVSEKQQEKFYNKIVWAFNARQSKYLSYHMDTNNQSPLKKFIKRLVCSIKYPIPDKMLDLIEERIYSKYPLYSSEKCRIFYPIKPSYSVKSFLESEEININGRLFNIPIGYDVFLREKYGDYMSYLPVSERFGEFYKMCNIVEERQQFYINVLSK